MFAYVPDDVPRSAPAFHGQEPTRWNDPPAKSGKFIAPPTVVWTARGEPPGRPLATVRVLRFALGGRGRDV
ncbi:MAG TPA: hypothetical protein VES61_06060, partial [Gaiellaceae bacterium]|nr:hypothetical protein [Gaiellaceae bacterium]